MSSIQDDGLENEPFFEEVRRRHPDVDFVILPPELEPEPLQVVSIREARRIGAETRDTLDEVWAAVAPGLVAGEAVQSWHAATVDGTVECEWLTFVDGIDGESAGMLLEQAEESLVARIWTVKAPSGGVPRLMASRRESFVQLWWWGDRLSLESRSELLAVTEEETRELLGEVDS